MATEPPRRRPLAGSEEDRRGALLEEREVRASDPALSSRTNERLTEELREAVGADRVIVPTDRPHSSEGQARARGTLTYLNQNRMTFIRTALIALTFGAVIALATNVWWLLPLAAGVHALGTMTVVFSLLHLTTVNEHPSPTLAAALTEEGVSSTDEYFTNLVAEFEPLPQRSAANVVAPGQNERSVSADADPARATAEQSAAMTPTGGPSHASGTGGTPDYINWGIIVALTIVSIAIPLASGGDWMWLLPAVMLPALALWAWLQWMLIADPERLHHRGPGTLALITLCVTLAVAAFCAVIALGLHASH